MTQPGVRTAWIFALLVACDAGQPPGPPAAVLTAIDPAPVTPDSASNRLAYLPANADLVIHVDVAALRQTALWPTYKADIARMLLPRTTCDYDALRDIATVDIGVLAEAKRGVFVVRGIDRAKMLDCIRNPSGAPDFANAVITVPRDKQSDVLTFVDANTMVSQRGEQLPAGLADVLAARTAPLLHDRGVADVLKHLPPNMPVTIVLRPSSEPLRKQWGMVGSEIKYLYGTLTVVPGHLVLDVAMVLASADQATQIATAMAAQLKTPAVKQMFEKLDATAQGTTVTTQIGVTDAQLASLNSMLHSMF